MLQVERVDKGRWDCMSAGDGHMMKHEQIKRKKTKTFNGCWSCRERGVKCDEQKPKCDNCVKNAIACKGYDIRLSWNPKKTDNSRRFKIYDHMAYKYFQLDPQSCITFVDGLVENMNYRNVLHPPFCVFESNGLVQFWLESVCAKFEIEWFKELVQQNLNDKTVIDSICASSLYFMQDHETATAYQRAVWEALEEQGTAQQDEEEHALHWCIAALNLLLTSSIVPNCEIGYFKTINEVCQILDRVTTISKALKDITGLVLFLQSLKNITLNGSAPIIDLSSLGLKSSLLQCWFELIALKSNKGLPFFELENKLWFKKSDLIFPNGGERDETGTRLHHRSYIWYVAIYINFIKKFYHEVHSNASIEYLIREVRPHLQGLKGDEYLGLRWCLTIIANECRIPECTRLLTVCNLDVPPLHSNWSQYIESSNTLIF